MSAAQSSSAVLILTLATIAFVSWVVARALTGQIADDVCPGWSLEDLLVHIRCLESIYGMKGTNQ
jgi:hypothetical protein